MRRERLSDLTGLRAARLSPGWMGVKALAAVTIVTVVLCGLLGRCSHPVKEPRHAVPVRTR